MKKENANFNLLPPEPIAAVHMLMRVTNSLLALAERETQVLVQRDLLSFSALQEEKEKMSARYARASEEFRGRVSEFRNIDKDLLVRLEKLQQDLAQKFQGNNTLVEHMKRHSERKTHQTLLLAQEYSRQKPLRSLQEQTQGA